MGAIILDGAILKMMIPGAEKSLVPPGKVLQERLFYMAAQLSRLVH